MILDCLFFIQTFKNNRFLSCNETLISFTVIKLSTCHNSPYLFRSKAKGSFPPRKAFSAVLCFLLMLVSLVASRLSVTSYISFSSSSMAFKGSSQQLLPAFLLQPKSTPIGCLILRLAGNDADRSVTRRMSMVSHLKCQRFSLCCKVTGAPLKPKKADI